MGIEEFKSKTIVLLEHCLAEAKATAISDGLKDEELELSNAYCEGLEDAIEKVEALSVEDHRQRTMIKASNDSHLTKDMLIDVWHMNGLMGVYNLGLEHMYNCFMEERSYFKGYKLITDPILSVECDETKIPTLLKEEIDDRMIEELKKSNRETYRLLMQQFAKVD